MKQNLAIFDLDGTLFDTSETNYKAYCQALEEYGVKLDRDYYLEKCSSLHYSQFLPIILGFKSGDIDDVHKRKKELYSSFLCESMINASLFCIISSIKKDYHIALATTASRRNTEDILSFWSKTELFELIVTQEDVVNVKPDPEGFIKTMTFFKISAMNTIIFEDSDVGVEAAKRSGASVYMLESPSFERFESYRTNSI